MTKNVASYSIEELKEGQEYSLEINISESKVDAFSELSGDISPLHINDEFAKERGFNKRVVHGMLISIYISKLIGVHFPGENSLLQILNLKFLSPAYINDTIKITAVIEHISLSTNIVIMEIFVKNQENDDTLVRGKVQIGFTQKIAKND